MFGEQVLEVDRLEFAQAVEVRCWSRGFIQCLIPERWITDFSCHAAVNFPPALPDAMDGVGVEECDVWRKIGGGNSRLTFPALSCVVHGSGVDQGQAVPKKRTIIQVIQEACEKCLLFTAQND